MNRVAPGRPQHAVASEPREDAVVAALGNNEIVPRTRPYRVVAIAAKDDDATGVRGGIDVVGRRSAAKFGFFQACQ